MSDLVEFYLARLDEDEQAAREAADYEGPHWTPQSLQKGRWKTTDYVGASRDRNVTHSEPKLATSKYADVTRHIALHDPASVLRDVEAKRQIVDTYTELRDRIDTAWREYSGWLEGSPAKTPAASYTSDELAKMHALEDVLKALTLPFASHPEYNESWRP